MKLISGVAGKGQHPGGWQSSDLDGWRVFPVKGNPFPASRILEMSADTLKTIDQGRARQPVDTGDNRLAQIVQSADDAIISKDLNGMVTTWNDGASRMFGYSTHEMIGHSIRCIIPADLHYEEDAILERIRAGQHIEHYETRRRRKSGEEFIASIRISPVKDSRGRILGASKIVRDITVQKQLDELVIQNEKLATTAQMAAVMAHQINNPLQALANLLFLALQRSKGDPATCEYLQMAQEELRLLAHLGQQSLGYYWNSAATVELAPSELLHVVLSVYRSRLVMRNIQVEERFEAKSGIAVRRGEILQVLSSIVMNAMDAMRSGGTLTLLTCDASKNGVQLIIRDSGTGIPKEHMNRLFEPFFTTKGTSGIGTSLWMAKRLVLKNGGEIFIESSTEAEDHGTAVSIFLPAKVSAN